MYRSVEKITAFTIWHSDRNATFFSSGVAFLSECSRGGKILSIFYRAIFPTGILNNLSCLIGRCPMLMLKGFQPDHYILHLIIQKFIEPVFIEFPVSVNPFNPRHQRSLK